jgi:hypothetical protein
MPATKPITTSQPIAANRDAEAEMPRSDGMNAPSTSATASITIDADRQCSTSSDHLPVRPESDRSIPFADTMSAATPEIHKQQRREQTPSQRPDDDDQDKRDDQRDESGEKRHADKRNR